MNIEPIYGSRNEYDISFIDVYMRTLRILDICPLWKRE